MSVRLSQRLPFPIASVIYSTPSFRHLRALVPLHSRPWSARSSERAPLVFPVCDPLQCMRAVATAEAAQWRVEVAAEGNRLEQFTHFVGRDQHLYGARCT